MIENINIFINVFIIKSYLDEMHVKPATEVLHDDESYVYAQPNKLKHQHKVGGKISDPITTYSTVAIDLDAETDDDTSKDGNVKLEDIDDGEAVVIHAGIKATNVLK